MTIEAKMTSQRVSEWVITNETTVFYAKCFFKGLDRKYLTCFETLSMSLKLVAIFWGEFGEVMHCAKN